MKQAGLLMVFIFLGSSNLISQSLDDYYSVIKEQGKDPVFFIEQKLDQYDLIIVDDALHPALEPYEFFCDYLRSKAKPVSYIFLEATHMKVQTHIDSFLNSTVKDTSILEPVFQEDFTYGWLYETYLTLFSTVWDVNQNLHPDERIRIIGVDQPVYWEGLHTREDYNIFQQSLMARDNFMYKRIMSYMNDFENGEKGIFITNTRHAYKCIKNEKEQPYWNAGTFFYRWHPGKTYSVRFHNMIMKIESVDNDAVNISSAGLERLVYKWVRIDEGLWDKAFAQNGNKPVAVPLKNNEFGNHPYIGNHMADVLPGQTMYDAYDALIFLKPLEETKFSAHTKFYYTDEFKKELEHRIRVIQGHNLDSFLQQNGFDDISEYVDKLSEYVPEMPNPLVSPIEN